MIIVIVSVRSKFFINNINKDNKTEPPEKIEDSNNQMSSINFSLTLGITLEKKFKEKIKNTEKVQRKCFKKKLLLKFYQY